MTDPGKASLDEKRTSTVVDGGATPVPTLKEKPSTETASSPIDIQKQPSTDPTTSDALTETMKKASLDTTSPTNTSETATSPTPSATTMEVDQVEKEKQDSTTTTVDQTEPVTTQPEPVTDPLVAQLKAQIYQQRHVLDHLEVERSQYRLDNQSLADRIGQMKTKIQQRTEAQQQLESNYLDHLRSMRATPDDMESIGLKLKQLKKKIRELADELLEQADPVVATKALRTFWLNLHDCIQAMGTPLPLHRVRMLTEKFMMDVLVQNMNLNVFPGLAISDHYSDLSFWLDKYDTPQGNFSTRLRQETALVMVKNGGGDLQKRLHEAVQANWKFLYGGLIKAYPFVYQHDKHEPNTRIHYGAKVQKLVELSMSLGFAMKGQEVDVAAAETRERVQVFDGKLMVDEDGQVEGIVDFCVCPPFVVYGPTVYTLEKGRVLCSPLEKSDPADPATATSTTATTTTTTTTTTTATATSPIST